MAHANIDVYISEQPQRCDACVFGCALLPAFCHHMLRKAHERARRFRRHYFNVVRYDAWRLRAANMPAQRRSACYARCVDAVPSPAAGDIRTRVMEKCPPYPAATRDSDKAERVHDQEAQDVEEVV